MTYAVLYLSQEHWQHIKTKLYLYQYWQGTLTVECGKLLSCTFCIMAMLFWPILLSSTTKFPIVEILDFDWHILKIFIWLPIRGTYRIIPKTLWIFHILHCGNFFHIVEYFYCTSQIVKYFTKDVPHYRVPSIFSTLQNSVINMWDII